MLAQLCRLLPLAAVLLVAACSPAQLHVDTPPAAAPGNTTTAVSARYSLSGRVVAMVPERQALLISHEAVKGLMGAMTMEFSVDATTLKAATKDAHLTADLVHAGDDWHLENVKFTTPVSP